MILSMPWAKKQIQFNYYYLYLNNNIYESVKHFIVEVDIDFVQNGAKKEKPTLSRYLLGESIEAIGFLCVRKGHSHARCKG